ncbi:MAG: hypothetical protein GY853_15945 [PVC group bacterium]|nr:hypothetical protein [PVC group bacterium]
MTAKKPPNQWKKGQSGNPKGRPKEKESIRYWLRNDAGIKYKDFPVKVNKEILNVYTEEELQDMTLAQIFSRSKWAKALDKGDIEITIEVDGKQPEHIKTEDITVHVPDQQEQQRMMNKFKYDIPSSKDTEGEDKIQ